MAGSTAKVVITERQQACLRKLSTATTAQRLVQRVSIILLAFAAWTNEDLAGRVGLGRQQIGLWRRRWQRAFNALVRIEGTEDSAAALRHAIEAVLTDEPRPGCPGKFTTEQLTLLFALAGAPSEKSGSVHYPLDRCRTGGRGHATRYRRVDLRFPGEPFAPRGRTAAAAQPLLAEHHRERPATVSGTGADRVCLLP